MNNVQLRIDIKQGSEHEQAAVSLCSELFKTLKKDEYQPFQITISRRDELVSEEDSQ